jgi:acetyl-CoA C-acetyltransferase/acetyl-CoA acyltransferase
MNGTRAAVVAATRTPFTKAGTVQKNVPAYELGRVALQEAVERSGLLPEEIDEVLFGNIAQPADATNIARVVALRAGLPERIPGVTVNRNCGSALQAVTDGARLIRTGEARVVAVGGTESMSGIPLLFPERMKAKMERVFRARSLPARLGAFAALRPSDFKPVIGLLVGLTDNYCGLNMGETAELLAREFQVGREEQDTFAVTSHQRAAAAQEAGRLAEEIVPVPLPREYTKFSTEDVGIRAEQSLEALARLKPVFDRRYGTVTAGNASQVTDGAGALILASESAVREKDLPVLGWVRGFAYAGLDPARMGLGPVYATARLLKETGVRLSDIELIEMNEAFAAQILANLVAFGSAVFAREHLDRSEAVGAIDPDRLNVNGGAIALGHPVGATGARLVQTLLLEMKRRDVSLGLVTLCIGGGQGAAVLLERA